MSDTVLPPEVTAPAADAAGERPLVVDLDGTLIKSDMLVESFAALLSAAPLHALASTASLRRSRAAFKADLAERVGLSPYYLLRVFRAEVGIPPYVYLESVRIRQAQRLIQQGAPLAVVAAEVGFNSQSHLTSSFKRIIGATPGQYARHLR